MNYSVVICSYNKLESLKIVVSGLQKIDGFENHEYILSDDFSTDGLIEWAHSCGFFDCVIQAEGDGGYRLNTLRNNGFERASNDVVVILDGDCVPVPTFFHGHSNVFSNYGNAISVGFTDFFDSDGKNMIRKDPRWGDGSGDVKKITWRDVFGGNIAIPKKIWNEVGKFDIDYNGEWGFEDLDFSFRANAIGVDFIADRRTVANHIQHPISKSHNASNLHGRNNTLFLSKHGFRPC